MLHLFLHRAACLLPLVLLMAGCVSEPVTPVMVYQYPETWTPAPTPTNTPPGPTATLVIQRTAGPLPTRDPNVKRIPGVPPGIVGVWLNLDTLTPENLAVLAPRAQVFAVSDLTRVPRAASQEVLLQTNARDLPLTQPLPLRADGILVAEAANLTVAQADAVVKSVAPRLVIPSLELKNAAEVTSWVQRTDGLCYCNFLRAPDAAPDAFPTETDWLGAVNTLAQLTSAPKALVLTNTAFEGDNSKNFDAMLQWFNYALGSYLLGANNQHAFFGFQGKGAQEMLTSQALAQPLGLPQGGMLLINGVYQRRFTRGLVLVNPSSDARTLSLPRNYTDQNGVRVTEVKLPPHSGAILQVAE